MKFLTLEFPELSDRNATMWRHFSVGTPSGFHAWGKLHLWGDTTDLIDKTDVVRSTFDQRSGNSISINFQTSQSTIPPTDAQQLETFVSDWCGRL